MKLSIVPLFAALCGPVSAAHDTYYERAIKLMEANPLVDTHIDLPQIIRSLNREYLEGIPKIAGSFPGHVDIPRMREGRLGGAFWTVWTPCDDARSGASSVNFAGPTDALRDALEVLDLIQNMIAEHSDHMQYARSSADIRDAFEHGKIASLLGMEGTHFLGNSLGVLRIFAQMGVRYLTLTHTCHSAFASSAGNGTELEDMHAGNGLGQLGPPLIAELNRLGIMVDLAHTSVATMKEAIQLSQAPVVWTHAGARSLWDHPRNVPDEVLALIGDGPGQKEGLIHSVFYPPFIGPVPGANLTRVADHIEYIADRIGRSRVGIGSDFDGMYSSVDGLEDASKYPDLVAEMLARGWSDAEVKDLMGRNLMRVMDRVDEVSKALAGSRPSSAIWEARKDLPATHWGGGEQAYFPYEVRDAAKKLTVGHDEL